MIFLLKMPRELSTEELQRLLEDSDFGLSENEMDSNSENSDIEGEPDSDNSDHEPSIFANDDIDNPDFDPGVNFCSNIITGDRGRNSPVDNSSDIVISSPRPKMSRRWTPGEIMRLTPQEINDIDRENGWSQEILPLSRQPYGNSPILHVQIHLSTYIHQP